MDSRKYDVRLKELSTGNITDLNRVTINSLVKYLKGTEVDIKKNEADGNLIYVSHTNSRTVNKNTNDKI
jgi:hypothetical protein